MDAARPAKRIHVVSFRLTDAEAAHVDAAAVTAPGRSRQDWCRAASLRLAGAAVPPPPATRRTPPRRLPKADVQALARVLAAVGKLGGHTNQLAKVANATGNLPAAGEVARVHALLTTIRDDLRGALEGGRGD